MPTQLSIATNSVSRLLKDETSYKKELSQQEARIEKLVANPDPNDENAEYTLKQQKTAVEETKAVFGPLRQKIADAVAKLEERVEEGGDEKEIEKAREVLKSAKEKLEEGGDGKVVEKSAEEKSSEEKATVAGGS